MKKVQCIIVGAMIFLSLMLASCGGGGGGVAAPAQLTNKWDSAKWDTATWGP